MFLHLLTHPRILASLLMMSSTVSLPAFGHNTNMAPTSLTTGGQIPISFQPLSGPVIRNYPPQPVAPSRPLADRSSAMTFGRLVRLYANTKPKQPYSFEKPRARSLLESLDRRWQPAIPGHPRRYPPQPDSQTSNGLDVAQGTPDYQPGPLLEGMADLLPPIAPEQVEEPRMAASPSNRYHNTRRTRWGEKLFQIIKCHLCHSTEGIPEPSLPSLELEYRNHAKQIFPGTPEIGSKALPKDNTRWQSVGSRSPRIQQAGVPSRPEGRNFNLRAILLRHGGEAQPAWKAFGHLPRREQVLIIEYLKTWFRLRFPDSASTSFLGGSRTFSPP